MRRRVSIARLMFAIGLAALSMAILRAWIGPVNWFGFLGLMSWMVLVSMIAGLVTSGPVRRFFVGFGAFGTVIWIAIWLDPGVILGSSWDYLILPVFRHIVPRSSTGLWRLGFMRPWAELGVYNDFNSGPGLASWFRRRTWICGGLTDLQALLLIPPASLAALGGLIAARYRPRSSAPSSLADRP